MGLTLILATGTALVLVDPGQVADQRGDRFELRLDRKANRHDQRYRGDRIVQRLDDKAERLALRRDH